MGQQTQNPQTIHRLKLHALQISQPEQHRLKQGAHRCPPSPTAPAARALTTTTGPNPTTKQNDNKADETQAEDPKTKNETANEPSTQA
jgi:hypothetical protein